MALDVASAPRKRRRVEREDRKLSRSSLKKVYHGVDVRDNRNGFYSGQEKFSTRDHNALSPRWLDDDTDGHFNFDLGDSLTLRYKIIRKIGEGTFGRVLECWDRDCQEHVAIKVIRSAEKYREAAMIEIDVLHTLGEKDRMGSRGCVQIRRWFDYRNHICIVFERLGPSLFDFLRTNEYRPFPVDLVRDFGRQLLESVAYMHGMSLIHTDLKPENVLLVSSEYSKVVDRKGEVLFQTHENLEHLAMMERVLGPMPSHIIKQSTSATHKYFKHGKSLGWPDRSTTSESIRAVHKLPRLRDLVMGNVENSASSLVDLLEQLLKYDPSERPTAKEALNHRFFQSSLRDQ